MCINTSIGADEENPLLPFAEEADSFVGEFEGGGVTIIIRQGDKTDSYVGEFKRGSKTYPMTAKLAGDTLKGSFIVSGKSFEFYLTIKNDTVTFLTPLSLKRKISDAAAKQTFPVPTPPVKTQPTKPLILDPGKTTSLIPAKTTLSGDTLRNRNWRSFGRGAYVTYADGPEGDKSLGGRATFTYRGEKDDNVMIRSSLNGSSKAPTGISTAAFAGHRTIEELGATKVEMRKEVLKVGTLQLDCEVTQYLFRKEAKNETTNVKIAMWRSKSIDLPSQSIDMPGGQLIIGGNIVAVEIEGNYQFFSGKMKLALTELDRKTKIGDTTITISVFKGHQEMARVSGVSRVWLESWVSKDVPGGVVRTKKSFGTLLKRQTMMRRAVGFGVSP